MLFYVCKNEKEQNDQNAEMLSLEIDWRDKKNLELIKSLAV